MNATILLGFLMVFFAVYTILTHNVLLRMRANTLKAWAQIEVAVARKAELVPQLLHLAQRETSSKSAVEKQAEQALQHWMEARGVGATANAHHELSGVLHRFLKSEQEETLEESNTRAILDEILRADHKIAFAQQYYNDAVTVYNLAIDKIPSFIVAKMGGFKKRQLFEPVHSMEIPDEIEEESAPVFNPDQAY